MPFNLDEVDVDGALREGMEEVSGDTRLSFLKKSALTGGAALSRGAIRPGFLPRFLNFALTLEYLERAFYNEATSKGIVKSSLGKKFLKTTTTDERNHVAFLSKALGKKAVKSPKFNFGAALKNETSFLDTAYVLENTGVHAYLGQAGNIKTPAYLLAAASIVTIEARHSGAIAMITGKGIDQVGSFDKGLPASAILKAVAGTKFIVG